MKISLVSPSPYPLPPGERVNILEKNPIPLDRGGKDGGDGGVYFTASEALRGFESYFLTHPFLR